MIWQQTMEALAVYIKKLEADLADVDDMVAAHAYDIDGRSPSEWPKDSVLAKAVERHTKREVERVRRAALNY